MIVIGSYEPLVPKKLYSEQLIADAHGETHRIPFLVDRCATRREYLDCLRECGQPNPERNTNFPYYYWIQMD